MFAHFDGALGGHGQERRRRKRRRKRRGGGGLWPDRRQPEQQRSLRLPTPRVAVFTPGGVKCDRSRQKGSRSRSRAGAAARSPNMELENIVANTVLLKAREGEDGDGGATVR